MVVDYKQDLPPKGGYGRIFVNRTFIKTWFTGPRYLAVFGGVTAYLWLNTKSVQARALGRQLMENDIRVSMMPFLMAERDRNWLKQISKNRAAEEELMKDVPGWQTGTYFGEPVYFTTDANDKWWEPDMYDVFNVAGKWEGYDAMWGIWYAPAGCLPKWYDKYLPNIMRWYTDV